MPPGAVPGYTVLVLPPSLHQIAARAESQKARRAPPRRAPASLNGGSLTPVRSALKGGRHLERQASDLASEAFIAPAVAL